MDPSTIELLEEDEDESLHSMADVKVFAAAMNWDNSGDAPSEPQPTGTDGGVLSEQHSSTPPKELSKQFESSTEEGNLLPLTQEREKRQSPEEHSSQNLASQLPSSQTQQVTLPPKLHPHQPMLSANNQNCSRPLSTKSHVPASACQMQSGKSTSTFENIGQKSQVVANKTDEKGVHPEQISSTGINGKQHAQLSLTSPSVDGTATNNLHGQAYTRLSIIAGKTSLKPEIQESQMKQIPVSQDETKRLHNGSFAHLGSLLEPQQNPIEQQSSQNWMHFQISSETPPVHSGNSVRTHLKEPLVGHKRPLEAEGTSTLQARKKQKASLSLLDQSIEQLNDVIAVSGVNLREEEEQLLPGRKEDSQASEATQRLVQEEEERLMLQNGLLQQKLVDITSRCGIERTSSDVEHCLSMEEEEQLLPGRKEDSQASEATQKLVQEEERLMLQKGLLQQKLADITSRCGIERTSSDVEHFLSMCVQERLRGLIIKLIRLSKQRIDTEKIRHRCVITSDVRCQILLMNQKAKEDWEKMQAVEAEKLQKPNETKGCTGTNTGKTKTRGRLKAPKTNKVEDDMMRTTAANAAVRAALGVDDMLSKWQLMAEQARQKREGALGGASGSQPVRTASHRMLMNFEEALRHQQAAEKRVPLAAATALSGGMRRLGRSQKVMYHPKIACRISTRDVIAALEQEPQMSKTILLYRLYERLHGNSATK